MTLCRLSFDVYQNPYLMNQLLGNNSNNTYANTSNNTRQNNNDNDNDYDNNNNNNRLGMLLCSGPRTVKLMSQGLWFMQLKTSSEL